MACPFNNIGIWFPSLEHMGGIERVILEHIRIFTDRGHLIVLILEEEPVRFKESISCDCIVMQKTQSRREQWESLHRTYAPQIVIFHGADFPTVKEDLMVVRDLGMKSILNIHFSFPSPIIFNEASHIYALHEEIGALVDGMATVSAMDAICWKAVGCNAWHVQNPFVHPASTQSTHQKSNTILWMGRFVEAKKPEEAIRVFSYIHQQMPEMKLQMLGCDYGVSSLASLIQELGLQDSVEILPSQNDTSAYYQNAALCLITSITESFCLVLAEAKWHGLPVAMYEIPFLELAEGNLGIVTAPFGDSRQLAVQALTLLKDKAIYTETSRAAMQSMERFNDSEVYSSWVYLFNQLATTPDENSQTAIVTRALVQAWNYHCSKNDWKVRFFDDTTKLLGCLPGKVARFCVNKLFPFLRRMKNRMK